MTREQLEDYRSKALNLKQQLESLKEQGGEKWTKSMQDKFNAVVLTLVDVDNVITEYDKVYHPKPGTEKMVHVSLIRGRRFNPNTGKEESEPFVQVFTYPEWQLFKKCHMNLGIAINEILHNPYTE